MPELPEVETITKQLDSALADKMIVGLDILDAKALIGKSADISEQKVTRINRRAKLVIIALSNGKYLIFHLKMTGQLIYIDHNRRIAGGHADHDWHASLPNKHSRIIFDFGDEQKLYFNDMRRFGWARVFTKAEMDDYFTRYGQEPLPKVDLAKLKLSAEKMKKSVIKKFLMDQGVIAGIGNIYADEILFASHIHPRRLVVTISSTEWQSIVKNTEEILNLAVKMGGTTDSDYVNAYGKRGGMQDYLKVYHHAGEVCPSSCGGKIERIVVGGRGTHFCPICQREKT